MINGLASGFRKIGHDALALKEPLSELEAREICIHHQADVLLEVNHARSPNVSLPRGVRHVSWFQDPITEDMFSGVHSDDIIYAITDTSDIPLEVGGKCKTGFLYLAVNDDTIEKAGIVGPRVDFCLNGYIPRPFSENGLPVWQDLVLKLCARQGVSKLKKRRWLAKLYHDVVFRRSQSVELVSILRYVIEQQYHPLRGQLDMVKLAGEMRFALGPQLNGAMSDFSLIMFAREYPRLLDRVTLIDAVRTVSESIELYGPHWDAHPRFVKYYRGILESQAELYDVYRRAEITLANNTHGLGLHSRTLECMAVGGFVLTHRSDADHRPGGIKTSFEPGVHYGEFTPENLTDQAARWLRDAPARRRAGAKAERIVHERHLWRHRAQQIVDDLNR